MGCLDMQGTAGTLCLGQVEGIVFPVVSKRGLGLCAVRNVDIELSPALMLGLYVDAFGLVAQIYYAVDVYMFTFLIQHLEGYSTTGTRCQVSALGIEMYFQSFLLFLLNAGLRTADNVFLAIVAQGVRSFIDGKYPTIDRTELTEEVASHFTVIEVFTVLAPVRMFRHSEIQHPTGIGANFIIAGIERVLKYEITVTIAVG